MVRLLSESPPQFSGWLLKAADKHHAYCSICKKTFELANMGRQAILSHAKGKGHTKLMKMKSSQPSLKSFLCANDKGDNPNEDSRSQPGSLKSVSLNQSCPSVESFCSRDEVARTEVLWALKVINSKMSSNSCAHIGEIFQSCFQIVLLPQNFRWEKQNALMFLIMDWYHILIIYLKRS